LKKTALLFIFLSGFWLNFSFAQLAIISDINEIDNSDTDQMFITASHSSSTGEMRVYFSQSVDHTYSRYKPASKVNILSKFIQRVNSAKYSIDACFYNITMEEVAQVFIGAHNRGVKVRVIYESDNENNVFQMMRNAGISIINDKFGNNNGDGEMHNKFMVIDHRDTTSAADDWVWTGSYNLTFSATYDNAENVIEIQDQALAECYTIEFNEMWGSETDTPDPSKSKIGRRKTNNTPHIFNINGIEVLQYMSPSDNGLQYLLREIGQSQSSLYFCMLSFTRYEIANAMKQKWMTINNFKVKGVFEGDSQYLNTGSEYYNLNGTGNYAWNPPADVVLDKERRLLHHKYLIIDGDGGPGQPVLVTGSYNWSYSAESSNDENFLIIKDSTIANLYLQEFAERYHKAGGVDELTFTSVETNQDKWLPTKAQLLQNYPNPFNSSTTIDYQIAGHFNQQVELSIYNLLGQRVKTLVSQKQTGGFYAISWDGNNESGELVSSGVYVYQLKVADVKMEKKLIFLQ
jgi:phosphatidylserine/phosphatidylglycerophosphate/cardiolipin synthase-like enzyme